MANKTFLPNRVRLPVYRSWWGGATVEQAVCMCLCVRVNSGSLRRHYNTAQDFWASCGFRPPAPPRPPAIAREGDRREQVWSPRPWHIGPRDQKPCCNVCSQGSF